MAEVELSKAKKIRETSDMSFSNKLIAAGWTLISTSSGKDESGYPITLYAFAWFKDEEPPQL